MSEMSEFHKERTRADTSPGATPYVIGAIILAIVVGGGYFYITSSSSTPSAPATTQSQP